LALVLPPGELLLTGYIVFRIIRMHSIVCAVSAAAKASELNTKINKKFELMLTRRATAYSSSGLVVWLKNEMFTLI